LESTAACYNRPCALYLLELRERLQPSCAAEQMHPLDIHWVYTFGSVALVAGAAFTGILALSFSPKRLSCVIPFMVSLAAGALLGTAFGHLLPESVERIGSGRKLSGLLTAGFVTFFVLEKGLCVWCSAGAHDHHRHGDLESHLTFRSDGPGSLAGSRPRITNLLFGAAVHSLIDGIAIATAYTVGTRTRMWDETRSISA